MDEQGRKMSKSLGNTIAPQEVEKQYGADILRLWVMNTDVTEDQRIGPDILKQTAELYRRLRNTLRWLLGSLAGFSQSEILPEAEMPELERWVLHRLWELDAQVREAVESHAWTGVYPAIHAFCAADLSAFYFDVRKDAIYCDRPDGIRRRAARTVLDHLQRCLTTWLAPVLVFTAEEAWTARFGEGTSVHLQDFPDVPPRWRESALAEKWAELRDLRRAVTGCLERARAEGAIGASLQAAPVLHLPTAAAGLLSEDEWAELAIVSRATLSTAPAPEGAFRHPDRADVAVAFARASGEKCARCWRVLSEVGEDGAHPALCRRCADAVGSGLVYRAAAE
jgi:isoleucyl-tRNA synthetase